MNAPQDLFAIKALGQGFVWGLKGAADDWAVCEFNDGEFDAMLLWSDEKAAKACAAQEWAGYTPAAIDLQGYVDSWLPAMQEDGIRININYGPKSRGSIIEAGALLASIRAATASRPPASST